jgi:hypothetical protein
LADVQSGLQRLSIKQYAQDVLDQSPPESDWAALASTAASLGGLLDDPSIGEKARNELDDIHAEIAELSRSKGDSDPRLIRSSQALLNSMLQSAKARLLEEIPGIDRPGFTKLYPQRAWPIEAFGKTKQYGL